MYFLTKHFQPTPTLLVYWSLLATGLTYTISQNIIVPALRYVSLFLEICTADLFFGSSIKIQPYKNALNVHELNKSIGDNFLNDCCGFEV